MCEDNMWDELIESVDVLRAEARNAQRVAAEVKRLKQTNAILLDALRDVVIACDPRPGFIFAGTRVLGKARAAIAAAEGAAT